MVGLKLVKNNPNYWDFIRILRSDPIIQKGFVEQIDISIDQQKKYMEKYNDCYYICLNHNNEPIGFVGEVDDDIRLAVVEQEQKKGVGVFMINKLMDLKPNSYAKVKHNNIASKKLFEKCGFNLTYKDENFLYYKK
jgi:RimJ/RimL family protein N-acetyltransferase